jgi:hypothetical protein
VLPVESGAIGTLMFIAFIVALAMVAIRKLPARTARATILSAIVGSVALSVGSNPFDVPISYMWLLLGLCFGIGLQDRQAGTLPSGVAGDSSRTEKLATYRARYR